ncbi:DUF389 domain-containing protein [Aquipuribacter sp. SD81]|uniref:DUF389 domain-containing protein n=1 Tax=Aquipuribacter sp. SD81 TaxID=3127703 RepID=UPI003015AA06
MSAAGPRRTWRTTATDLVLPPQQRRSLDELSGDLDLSHGDASSKRSAFWTMLLLSAVIATAGVLSDSTATVIGAMIIAPLSTPIMGTALGIARIERRVMLRSLLTVALGVALVVGVGASSTLTLPDVYDLVGNSQVAGRTSPGLLDLVAALATGLAGAVGLARRDVAAVLPGVAIAISLVPPLAVVGVCLGQGRTDLALGAGLLFVSNLLALVLAGTLVFAALEVRRRAERRGRRRAWATIGGLLVVVTTVLAANTGLAVYLEVATARARTVAEEWAAPAAQTEVTDVQVVGTDLVVSVRTPADPPDLGDLVARLGEVGWLPALDVVVETTQGRRLEAGTVPLGVAATP